MKTFFNLRFFSLLLSLLVLGSACAKEDKFIFREQVREKGWVANEVKVKEFQGASGIDIIWVIDNSGSMGWAQQNVITNTGLFMQEFLKNQLDWKMGLVSTDTYDQPYLGFSAPDRFDSTSADPVARFQSAVSDLGTSGSGSEKSFAALLQGINNYPSFLRPNYPLAIIMVTDAREQSNIPAASMASQIKAFVGQQKYYAYAILGARDFNCTRGVPMGEEAFDYAGSAYEGFLNSADLGKAYSLCSNDFGQVLADMGKEIAQQVTRSKVFLKDRPKLNSISVIYNGSKLKAGSQRDGGVWYYDYKLNAIVFYNLSFALQPTDSVSVHYQVDDGFDLASQ